MIEQPRIVSERLVLRPFSLSDAPEVQRLAGAWAIADTTLNIPHPYLDGMAEAWISMHAPNYESGELANFAITEKSDGTLMGAIGLVITRRFQRAELGYWIGKDYWNRGICSEAALAVIAFGFEQLALNKIIAHHLARNPASGRVMEKAGMVHEGTLRSHVIKGEVFEDLVAYRILRSEWEAG